MQVKVCRPIASHTFVIGPGVRRADSNICMWRLQLWARLEARSQRWQACGFSPQWKLLFDLCTARLDLHRRPGEEAKNAVIGSSTKKLATEVRGDPPALVRQGFSSMPCTYM
jgi:hypothetical protein